MKVKSDRLCNIHEICEAHNFLLSVFSLYNYDEELFSCSFLFGVDVILPVLQLVLLWKHSFKKNIFSNSDLTLFQAHILQ